MSATLENEQRSARAGSDEGLTAHGSLKNGAKPHALTDEDRAKSLEIRRQKRAEAEQLKLEALAAKAYKRLDRNIDSESDGVAQRAVEFIWEQLHGKATQRVETTDTSSNPFDKLSPEDQEAVAAAIRAKLALVREEPAA